MEWGWYLDTRRRILMPITTDQPAWPPNLLKVIQCGCKTSSSNPCGSNNCSCKWDGLKCVAACGNCRGVDCNNCEEIEHDYDTEELCNDGNIFETLQNL